METGKEVAIKIIENLAENIREVSIIDKHLKSDENIRKIGIKFFL